MFPSIHSNYTRAKLQVIVLQCLKAYAKYCYSNSTEVFNSTLPISSSVTNNSFSSTSSKVSVATTKIPSTPTMSGNKLVIKSGKSAELEGQYLKATTSISIEAAVADKFICKQSKLEAPEIYLPKEELICNDGYEFLGHIHYDDYT